MIDFSNLGKYKENNRIEAKKATGGLPKSIWETYSAFANTIGGIILLGVEELEDKTLRAVNLPDPEEMVMEFQELLNNPQKVSINILSQKNISIEKVDGKSIIAITVPRAKEHEKPVYIDGNPTTGTYRRDGDGDYRCSKEEVDRMLKTVQKEEQLLEEEVLEYITRKVSVKRLELAKHFNLKSSKINSLLSCFINEGILITEGKRKNRVYKLKEKSY